MRKKLVKHGNSLSLVIDKPVLELLGIDADSVLDVKTDGKRLIVSPATDNDDVEQVQRILEKLNAKYGKMLKRLAE